MNDNTKILRLTEDELHYLMAELGLASRVAFNKRAKGTSDALDIQKSAIVKIHDLKHLFEIFP